MRRTKSKTQCGTYLYSGRDKWNCPVCGANGGWPAIEDGICKSWKKEEQRTKENK